MKRTREKDRVFELLWLVETGSPYTTERGRHLPRSSLGRINKATAEAKRAGYGYDELMTGLQTWPALMSDRVNVTALALISNMPRLLHVADGGSFRAPTAPRVDAEWAERVLRERGRL